MKGLKIILSVFIVSVFGFLGTANAQQIGQILQTIKDTAQAIDSVVKSVSNSANKQGNQSTPQNPQQDNQNYGTSNSAGTVIGKHYYEEKSEDYEGGVSIRYLDNGQAVVDINTLLMYYTVQGERASAPCEVNGVGKVRGNIIDVNEVDEYGGRLHFKITINNNIAVVELSEDDDLGVAYCGNKGGFTGTYTFAEQNNLRIGALKEAHSHPKTGCNYYFDANKTQKAAVYDAEKGRGVIYGNNNQVLEEFESENTVFNLDGYDRELKEDKYEVQNIPVPEGYFIFRKYLYEGYSLILMHKNDAYGGNTQDGEALLFVERNRSAREIPLHYHCSN